MNRQSKQMNASGSDKNIKKSNTTTALNELETGNGKQYKIIGLSFVKENTNKSCRYDFLLLQSILSLWLIIRGVSERGRHGSRCGLIFERCPHQRGYISIFFWKYSDLQWWRTHQKYETSLVKLPVGHRSNSRNSTDSLGQEKDKYKVLET